MKGKKKRGGGANWMDTYGDMVTLLLCFFVLLYSMSSISEENWKALVMSFNPSALRTVTETPGGDGPNADVDESGMPIELNKDEALTQEEIDQQMEDLYEAIKKYVENQGSEDTISVTRGDGRVYVSFNQTVFFNGNSAVLRSDAYEVLGDISDILDTVVAAIDEVRIQGHTAQATGDPTQSSRVAFDRTLSSQRATNVVIYIQENCTIDPARLVSEGMGQWRPVASNDTEEGRAKNRRVEMIISGRNIAEEMGGNILSYEVE